MCGLEPSYVCYTLSTGNYHSTLAVEQNQHEVLRRSFFPQTKLNFIQMSLIMYEKLKRYNEDGRSITVSFSSVGLYPQPYKIMENPPPKPTHECPPLLSLAATNEPIKIYKEEVIASNVMKELTNKYGTRGKSPKSIFLSAFEEELAGGAKGRFLLTCDEDEESNMDSGTRIPSPNKVDLVSKAHKINHSLGQMLERPAAMVTQSAFLHKLDEQVKSELVRLGCGPPTYEMYWLFEESHLEDGGSVLSVRDALQESEEKLTARLKIYKRAFGAIILHFEALRPILREIKRVYDFVLNLKEQQLKDAKTISRNIQHAEKALDAQMEKVRFEGYLRVAELEKQCMLLMTHVEKQDAAITTMTTILVKLETALSEEHDIRRESEDSRKLLIVEINELRRKMGMNPRQISGAEQVTEQEEAEEEDVITTEDPMILRAALENTRKNLSDAQNRLTILEADYSDVIPRHDFEELKVAMEEVKESQKKTNETYDTLAAQVQGFKDQIEKLIAERDTLQELTTGLRTKATPRPSWTKVADNIQGGLDAWNSMTEGLSSDKKVDKLIEELTGKKMIMPPEYKSGLGTTEDVPRHLRYDGLIRIRYFGKRDIAVIIQDVWQTRIQQLDKVKKHVGMDVDEDEEEEEDFYAAPAPLPPSDGPEDVTIIKKFPEFFADFFEEKYYLPSLRMEWTYNLIDSAKRIGTDERLNLFLSILEGSTDEEVYHLSRSEANRLNVALRKRAEDFPQTGGSLLSVPLSEFRKVLKDTFPDKTADEIERLSKAAAKQSTAFAEWSAIRFGLFFQLTDEGMVGEFMEEMAKQLGEDRLRYVYEILTEVLAELGVSLAAAEREDDPAGETDVTTAQLYNALTAVDPTIPDEKIGAALAWLFFGESSLPGSLPKGLLLVDYIKSHQRSAGYDSDDEDEQDDEDFERVVRDIMGADTMAIEDDDLTAKQRRAKVKKLKVTSLRTIVKRLKGSAFLRHGRRYPKADGEDAAEATTPTPIPGDHPPDGTMAEGVEGGASATTAPAADGAASTTGKSKKKGKTPKEPNAPKEPKEPKEPKAKTAKKKKKGKKGKKGKKQSGAED